MAAPTFSRPPVVIGGCGRSGTTLLLAMLSAHPSLLAIPFETMWLCPTAYDRAPDLKAPLELDKLAEWLAAQEIPASCTRWLEKTPKNVLFFGPILSRFGREVRLIHLVRDGRDVVTSRHPHRRVDQPWVTPERWIEDVSAGLKYQGHPQVATVRYEDLVQDYETTMGQLCRFLDEDFHPRLRTWHDHATVRRHPAWAGEVRPLHQKSVRKWSDPANLAPVEQLLARPEAVGLLERLGYLEGSV